jgi:hypothetical protein
MSWDWKERYLTNLRDNLSRKVMNPFFRWTVTSADPLVALAISSVRVLINSTNALIYSNNNNDDNVNNDVTCWGCTWCIDGSWIGWLDLLTPYILKSGLQIIQQYRYSPPFRFHRCKHTRVLNLHCPLVVSWQRIYNSLTITSYHT